MGPHVSFGDGFRVEGKEGVLFNINSITNNNNNSDDNTNNKNRSHNRSNIHNGNSRYIWLGLSQLTLSEAEQLAKDIVTIMDSAILSC